VVVPFRGTPAQLDELCQALTALELEPGDSLVVVDNTPGREAASAPGEAPIAVRSAAGVTSPGFARNRGAEGGSAEWIVFFDADTLPVPDLLDRYFSPSPRQRTALLAGGVLDEEVPPDGRPVARYAHIRGLMAQDNTFGFGEWSFPQTANVACRRTAFEAAAGFREDIRAGEDADLTFRVRAAGWQVERREAAAVVHRGRQTVRGLVAQKLNHGAGGAWLADRYPGAFPARRRPGLIWWGVRTLVSGLVGGARHRDRDRVLRGVFEPLEHLSFEFGRSLANHDRRRR
jgi:GT2 family glycosyltransferase